MATLFSDEMALFVARQSALNPTLALNNTSVVMGLAQALLSFDNDTNNIIASNIPNQLLGTATGAPLIALAADRGVPLMNGTPSTGTIVFKVVNGTAASPIVYQAGTLFSVGDGITTPNVAFSTQAIATINTGQSVSNAVTAQSTTSGLATNIAAGAALAINTPISGTVVSNAVADGGTAFTGGTDPWGDAQYRAQAIANTATKYGAVDVQAQILTVANVYDAYVSDPQNGSGAISYQYCDKNGASPGLVSASAVAAAVNGVLPPQLIISPAASNFSNVVLLTSIPITYSAPPAVQASVIEPQIKQAVVNYIQGQNFTNGQPSYAVPTAINAQSGLIHGQALDAFKLGQYVQAAVGFQLTAFVLGGTTPASGTASNGTVYRVNGGPSVVQLTRA